LYDKKVSRAKAEKEWQKISLEDGLQTVIMNAVVKYVKATPDKKYRKDAERWLKHKCWNDEIVITTPKVYESAKDKSRREFNEAIWGKVNDEQPIIDIN
jgi:hypothetical protein